TMPGCVRIALATAATSRSMSRPARGRTWMVISLDTSDCHSAADALTSSTTPVVTDARNVMMATTATSARPAIEARGTIGDMLRARAGTCGRSCPRSISTPRSSPGLLIDVQPPLMQYQPPCVVLVHQGDVVGGDDDRRTRLVEFDEQPQQAPSKRRIDVAGRLVGQQQLWARDDSARDRRALLLAAGQDRRQRIHAIAETDPLQQIDHLAPVARFGAPHHAEWKRDILVGRHMIEQAEILQHDADALAQVGDRFLVEQRYIVAEQVHEPPGRPQRQEQEPQQGGLPRAGRAGEKLEGMGRNLEAEVAQNLRAEPVAQTDIFEPDQS